MLRHDAAEYARREHNILTQTRDTGGHNFKAQALSPPQNLAVLSSH